MFCYLVNIESVYLFSRLYAGVDSYGHEKKGLKAPCFM